jgi:hypothetical protein
MSSKEFSTASTAGTAEQSPAEQSPAEHSPAEHSPAEHSPAEHSPAEQSSAERSPAEQSRAEHSQATENVQAVEPTQGAGPSRATNDSPAGAFMNNPILAMIFKHDKFFQVSQENKINNLLVGKTLPELYGGNKDLPQGKQHYIGFVSNDWEGDLIYALGGESSDTAEAKAKILRDCLKDHSYDPTTCEATIHGTNIVLNIWEWANADDCTQVPGLKDKMIVKDDAGMYTTYSMFANPSETPVMEWNFDSPEWDGMAFKIPIKVQGDKDWFFVELEKEGDL